MEHHDLARFDLAAWAAAFDPTADDLALSRTALVDTVAVAVAARAHPVLRSATALSEAGQWGVACHVLDFDDLHVESTTHISAVCVPAALASGGDAHAYLGGAEVMARLGTMLGWASYRAGWHTTCTAGALAAAVAAEVALGLGTSQLGHRAGAGRPCCWWRSTHLRRRRQVASSRLRGRGGSARRAARRCWGQRRHDRRRCVARFARSLLGGTPTRDFARTPSVPGGLAAKLHPCCYAMQRPIAAVSGLAEDLQVADVKRVLVRTPEGSVTPLIHHRPTTSLEAKFSLEYAVAVSLLRPYPGIDAFTDAIVTDPNLHHLLQRVEVELTPGGQGLLDGVFEVEAQTQDATRRATCALPPVPLGDRRPTPNFAQGQRVAQRNGCAGRRQRLAERGGSPARALRPTQSRMPRSSPGARLPDLRQGARIRFGLNTSCLIKPLTWHTQHSPRII